MKGNNEYLRIVALVIIICLLWPFLSATPMATRASSSSSFSSSFNGKRMVCTKDSESFWLRNACHSGFVVVVRTKKKNDYQVVAQHRGLDRHSKQVELLKETCYDVGSGFTGSVKTRLYSPHTDKYICFNKRGKISAKPRKAVQRMGKLCSFLEKPIRDNDASMYVSFQSAYNPKWYLGFDGKHQHRSFEGEGRITLPHRMRLPQSRRQVRQLHQQRRRRHRLHKRRQSQQRPLFRSLHVRKSVDSSSILTVNKCDFQFSTGPFRLMDVRDEYHGLIKHIRQQQQQQQKKQHRQFEETAATINSIVVDIDSNGALGGSKMTKKSYYYIENNDERYRTLSRGDNDDDDEDEEEKEIEDKKEAFLNFKMKLRRYNLKAALRRPLSFSRPKSLTVLKKRKQPPPPSKRRRLRRPRQRRWRPTLSSSSLSSSSSSSSSN